MGNKLKQALIKAFGETSLYDYAEDGDRLEVWIAYQNDGCFLRIEEDELVVTRCYDEQEHTRIGLCDEEGNPSWGDDDLAAIIKENLKEVMDSILTHYWKEEDDLRAEALISAWEDREYNRMYA